MNVKNKETKMLQRLVLGAGIASMMVVAAASAQQRGVTKDEVLFGMHTDLSGVAATYGVSSSNAVKMRFDEVNEAGGIHGRKLRVIVEGVNIISRHRRPSQTNPQGGITRQEAPIHVSNVMLLDPKSGTPTRVGKSQIIDKNTGKKKFIRRSVTSGETIE